VIVPFLLQFSNIKFYENSFICYPVVTSVQVDGLDPQQRRQDIQNMSSFVQALASGMCCRKCRSIGTGKEKFSVRYEGVWRSRGRAAPVLNLGTRQPWESTPAALTSGRMLCPLNRKFVGPHSLEALKKRYIAFTCREMTQDSSVCSS